VTKEKKKPAPRKAGEHDMPSDKKRKRKGDAQTKGDKRTPKPRSVASEPRGRKGKAKKRRRHQGTEETAGGVANASSAPPAPTTAPLTARALPEVDVDVDDSYELTADGDDLEALSSDAPELGIGGRVVAPHVRFEEDALESYRPAVLATGDVEDQIRALEARLDGLIQGAARTELAPSSPEPALAATPTPELEIERDAAQSAEAIAVESAAELAGSRYYVEKWGRKGLRSRAEEVDEFGLDRSFEARLRPVLDFIYHRYFRIQTEGISNVPAEGRAVVVGNHSGSIPIDGLMLRTALRVDHPASRDLRWLAEDFLFYLPFAGVLMNRTGAVRACQENAERLLSRDNLIAVFPEGVQGIRKLFRDRYRLQRFGRGGYIRLCLRTRAPLIPCAIIGGEESSPLLYRFDALADLLRVPYLPVTPTFPALGALGLLPAPTKWRIKFGEPIAFDNYGPEAADDDLLVGRLSDRVRSTIQSMLDTGLQKRRSIWF
jgi:1-acyl-sn-glycerol-3-phosphate acyltransferase